MTSPWANGAQVERTEQDKLTEAWEEIAAILTRVGPLTANRIAITLFADCVLAGCKTKDQVLDVLAQTADFIMRRRT